MPLFTLPFSLCNTVSCLHKYRMIYFWLAVFGVLVPFDRWLTLLFKPSKNIGYSYAPTMASIFMPIFKKVNKAFPYFLILALFEFGKEIFHIFTPYFFVR